MRSAGTSTAAALVTKPARRRVAREAAHQLLGLVNGLAALAGDVAHGPLDDARHASGR